MRLSRADLSSDYSRQDFVPFVPAVTTGEFIVQRQGFEVSLFGISNEGSGEKVTMITNERAQHDYNAMCSQLHFYLERIKPRYSNVHEMVIHMDSCAGQNKNNSVV